MGVSERHLRRALERELGVSPAELAQTHRLLLAKRLLAETALPVTRVAYASGFQSLRRFNAVFRERYRLSPSALRRAAPSVGTGAPAPAGDSVTLTLAYRPPLDWPLLLDRLALDAVPGVIAVDGDRYARTVRLEGRIGAIAASNVGAKSHLEVGVSLSLLPVLMPLLAGLRHLFDLDAEPAMVDAHLAQHGLAGSVRRHPGVRIPGAMDGFEVALGSLLREEDESLLERVVSRLGEPVETGLPELFRLGPTAVRVAQAGVAALVQLGVSRPRAATAVAVARAIAEGGLQLQPGSDVVATHRALLEMEGVGERLATMIVMRALYWPDAFPTADPTLQRSAGAAGRRQLREHAERWRPWRAYAAQHLWLEEDPVRSGARDDSGSDPRQRDSRRTSASATSPTI
jgi:AraC family transcriptional regulator of adaptative response / DNA-3-methyladenine glycosylase II